MIFNKDNFLEAMNNYKWFEDDIKITILSNMEMYEPTHFFLYEKYIDEELDTVDIVFCNRKECFNIYLIIDMEGIVIDYDFTYAININILYEDL